MEERINIERCNIPMKQVFAEEPVRQAVSNPSSSTLAAVLAAGLPYSPRTLRQYMCLAGESCLEAPHLAQLTGIFTQADKISPISIEDQYPWLKQDDWTLEMRDVSYYKITAELGQGPPCSIRQIRWQGSRQTLWFDPEAAGDLPQPYPVCVNTRPALLQFIKRLLLEGQADLTLLQGP